MEPGMTEEQVVQKLGPPLQVHADSSVCSVIDGPGGNSWK
jgi:hypothetical protein